MKRILSLLFAALMLFSLTALAEGHDPFMSATIAGEYALPKDALADIRTVYTEHLKTLLAAVKAYESTVDKLLPGEEGNTAPETGATGATANEVGAYRVIVRDEDGNPVKGAVVQLCDDTTCSLQKTTADGVATFEVKIPKVYEVHVAKVPEGYVSSDETYETLDTWSDVNITVSKAE